MPGFSTFGFTFNFTSGFMPFTPTSIQHTLSLSIISLDKICIRMYLVTDLYILHREREREREREKDPERFENVVSQILMLTHSETIQG